MASNGLMDFGMPKELPGLFGNVKKTVTEPMFMAGAGLLSGGGWQGAMQGAQMGAGLQEQERDSANLANKRQMHDALLAQQTDPGMRSLLAAAGPEQAVALLSRLKAQEQGEAFEREKWGTTRPYIEAQTKAMGQKNALEESIASMLSANSAPTGSPDQSILQPQSLPTGNGQPSLQQASDTGQPAGLFAATSEETPAAPDGGAAPIGPPNPGAVYEAPGTQTVNTPLGPMTRDRARRLGLGLAVAGKGDAGRMLIDAATGGVNLAKPSVNTLEERTINSAAQLARMGEIEKRFKPQFLEIPKRFRMLGLSWSAKLGSQLGGKLSQQQTVELQDYASFRSASVNNLNTILKELSGAAVTPQEYERIQNDQPVAGTGLFDGDDPVSFKSKLDRTKDTLKSAIARYNFMRTRGLDFPKDQLDQFLSLDDVPAAYERRGEEIERDLRQKNPTIQPQALEELSARQLKREWGI